MTVPSFLDTNILVYTDDADSLDKHEKALSASESNTGILATP